MTSNDLTDHASRITDPELGLARIDAVVIAGGVPRPGDPLYPLTQGRAKALLSIAGKPMLQWVLDALDGSPLVRRIAVVGLPADTAGLSAHKELSFLPNAGSMIGNAEAGVKHLLAVDPAIGRALIVSSDIPCLSAEMVAWMINTCQSTEHEIYYGLVAQADMERRFPGSRRSYFTLREGRFCGADLIVVSTALIGHYHPAWHEIVGARKNILRQASIVGFDTLLLMLLRQMSIPEAERRAQTRLGVKGRILLNPYAEAGMDVDKPRQYELVAADLAGRQTARHAGA
jgi:GTP:adenosylcobinamide-phosphate guanylyltransferase